MAEQDMMFFSGLGGSSGGHFGSTPLFGTPDLRQGFQSANPLPPSIAGQGRLEGGLLQDTRSVPGVGPIAGFDASQVEKNFGQQFSQQLQGPAQLAPDAASGPPNVAQSLGGLIQGIGGIPSQIGKSFNGLKDISFQSEATIGARADTLFMDKIKAFEEATGTTLGSGAEDQRLLQEFDAEAKSEAAEAGAAANQQAFNFTVGMRGAQEGFNIAMNNRMVKDQLNTIQNDTERFINGVEFNAKMQQNAQDIVGMRNNLRTIDSILQQTGPIQAGKQQQMFARNPVTGNLLTEL